MMSNNDLLIALLTAIGNRVPILIALGVALVMVLDTPRGRVRTVALSALTLLLATSLVGGLLAVLPLWLLSSGDFQRLSGFGSLLGLLQMARGLVEALGMVALAWALVHALRAGVRPPSA